MKQYYYFAWFRRTFYILFLLPALPAYAELTSVGNIFIENVGQVTDQYYKPRPDIGVKVKGGNGLNIFLGTGMLHYVWASPTFRHSGHSAQDRTAGYALNAASAFAEADIPAYEMHRIDVELIGANPHALLIKEGEQSFYERYFQPWVNTGNSNNGVIAHSYEKITYKNIYPNIDWVFYFNERGLLEHDFIVHPGGRVSDIRMKYSGAKNLVLRPDGSLSIAAHLGRVTENAPYSYQQKDRAFIPSSFVLDGNILSFSTAPYSGTLVIDPTLEWATYFGGSEYDVINSLVTGKDNYIYAAGTTGSTSNIATTGSHQTTFGGGSDLFGSDAFISKWDRDGKCLWATYYGGTNVDAGLGIMADTSGFIYLAGRSNSGAGIATSGTHQPTKAGTNAGYDAYIVQFDGTGTRQWGSYFGGTGADGTLGVAVTCDRNNNIYLAGNTASTNGIATTGAHQAARNGAQDGFLAKWNTSGTLEWATYFGGNAQEYLFAVKADANGNVFIGGATQSATGLATSGAPQATLAGEWDGCVAKFNPSGQQLWATYFGGANTERIVSLAVDTAQGVYIAGFTNSNAGIATTSAHQTVFGGSSGGGNTEDGFLARYTNGGLLEWATYYGGDQIDLAYLVYCSKDNRIFLGGSTGSPKNMATTEGLRSELQGDGDGFLAEFTPSGRRVSGSYIGGNYVDAIYAITDDGNENIFVGGNTSSINQLATGGAHQTVFGGDNDGMLIRINMCLSPERPDTVTGSISVCEGSTELYRVAAVEGTSGYVWILPEGWSGSSDADSIETVAGVSGGNIQVAALNDCGSSDTFTLAVTVNPAPQPQVQRNGNVLQTTQTYSAYQWLLNEQAIAGGTGPTHLATENGDYSATVTADNGCTATSEILNVNDITGINELAQYGIQVYPNPVSEQVYITLPFDATVRLTDITGRLLNEYRTIPGTVAISLQAYQQGLYILNFFDRDNKYLGSVRLSRID